MCKENSEMESRPLVDSDYLLQKFPGKGGWTYAEIPEVLQNSKNPFGWVKVKGSIDGYKLTRYKLMPMGKGKLFLPVKSEIRKKIKKGEGDLVRIVLYADDSPIELSSELRECFSNEPSEILWTFLSFTESEQEAYLKWIDNAKSEYTKVERIAKMMERLSNKLRLHD